MRREATVDPRAETVQPGRRAVHLTSAHGRRDVRIFLKECASIARAGWSTVLLVADGQGDARVDGVDVVDVGKPIGRWRRMTTTPRRLLARALELDADVYHLHDPELIPLGVWIKRHGKRVVFDSHEDVPKDLLGKTYLPTWLRVPTSRSYAAFERWACRRFDAIVAATPAIRAHFAPFHPRVVDVNNYPLPSEIAPVADRTVADKYVCYVGGISRERGVVSLVDAMDRVDSGARLQLIGAFMEGTLSAEVRNRAGWRNVDETGQLDRDDVRSRLAGALAGIVTYLPEPNHLEAQPNKLFEYMGAGLPVIVSDFPLWRAIVEENDCGICVDPRDPDAIADAIDALADDTLRAAEMGRNGRRAVIERFNWTAEERKLLDLYTALAA